MWGRGAIGHEVESKFILPRTSGEGEDRCVWQCNVIFGMLAMNAQSWDRLGDKRSQDDERSTNVWTESEDFEKRERIKEGGKGTSKSKESRRNQDECGKPHS